MAPLKINFKQKLQDISKYPKKNVKNLEESQRYGYLELNV